MSKSGPSAEAKALAFTLLAEALRRAAIVVMRPAGIGGTRLRVPGDWNDKGRYDKAVFAPMTDKEMRQEGWPV